MKLVKTLTAASIIALSSVAVAEQPLSMDQMDNISAGGFAIADAIATALGNVTATATNTVANTQAIDVAIPQLGKVFIIYSDALAQAASDSDAKAIATAEAFGATIGSLMSDTVSNAATATDMTAALPFSAAASNNTSLASTMLLGVPSAAASQSVAATVLAN